MNVHEILTTARTNAEMGFVETAIEDIVHANGSVTLSGAVHETKWFCTVALMPTLNTDEWSTGSQFGLTMSDALVNAITEALS